MATYKLLYARYAYITVEADSEDEAIEIADGEDIEGQSDCGWYYVETQDINVN